MGQQSAYDRGFAAWIAATLLPTYALRVSGAFDRSGHLIGADAWGFLSDLALSLIVAALAVALARASRGAGVLAVAVWALCQYVNYELVLALGAPGSFRDVAFLFDGTFVQGSVLHVSRPWLLAAGIIVPGAIAWRASVPRRATAIGVPVLCGLAILATHTLWGWDADVPTWRQANFLETDVLGAWSSSREAEEATFRDPASALLDSDPGLAGDLDAAFWLTQRPRNVLLVFLESVSGAYLPSHTGFQRRTAAPRLDGIDAIAGENLFYPNFVAHQRKTNRGLYAALCGELPNLGPGIPKMSAFVERGWRDCLPRVLRDAGYATTYLQAAPLAFMMKDQFMPRAGFERVGGNEAFRDGYVRSAWGVDDRAFFEQAVPVVEELATGGRPWLLTLLNVGTHHPFVIPDDYRVELTPRFHRTLHYLDESFTAFYRELERRGLLRDTLVVVTSDESGGVSTDVEPAMTTLSQNWGFLIVRTPDSQRKRIDAPFALMDLPLSIVDALGLAERGAHFFGRSVFRQYREERRIYFANSNLRSAGSFAPGGLLTLCLFDFAACGTNQVPGGRYFGPERAPVEASSEADRVRRIVDRSHPGMPADESHYAFLGDPHVRIEDDAPRIVHGGQYVDVAADEWLEVEYDVAVRGEEEGKVFLVHVLAGRGNSQLFRREIQVPVDRRVRLVYTYAPEKTEHAIQSKTIARIVEGSVIDLHHRAARMVVRRSGPRPPPGFHLEKAELSRLAPGGPG